MRAAAATQRSDRALERVGQMYMNNNRFYTRLFTRTALAFSDWRLRLATAASSRTILGELMRASNSSGLPVAALAAMINPAMGGVSYGKFDDAVAAAAMLPALSSRRLTMDALGKVAASPDINRAIGDILAPPMAKTARRTA